MRLDAPLQRRLIDVPRKLNPHGRAHRDVGVVLRRRAEDHLGRRAGRDPDRLFFRRGVGRRLPERQASGLGVEQQEPARLLHRAAQRQPSAGVDARVEAELELLAGGVLQLRPHVGDPDRRVGRAEDEVVAALAGRVRHPAEQVAPRELPGDGDLLIEKARRVQHDGADGRLRREYRRRHGGGDDRGDLTGPRPRRIGIDLEGLPQIVGAQADVVRLHAPEIPELAAHLVEPVGGGAFEQQVNRGGVVGQAELILLDPDLADDQDRAAMKKPRIGEHRRQVGRAPDRRLRIARRRHNDQRKGRQDRQEKTVS